ncbi:hypothetical protein TSMEX_000728 [Taenia solium]|eukprot:TsM_001153200 transcript=TsM_001153200 gene=TsM_001153200
MPKFVLHSRQTSVAPLHYRFFLSLLWVRISSPKYEYCSPPLPPQGGFARVPPNPYHISFAPVSMQDSEHHSLSSGAHTEENLSHIDGAWRLKKFSFWKRLLPKLFTSRIDGFGGLCCSQRPPFFSQAAGVYEGVDWSSVGLENKKRRASHQPIIIGVIFFVASVRKLANLDSKAHLLD